jgi:AraC-like DNA-binding protein
MLNDLLLAIKRYTEMQGGTSPYRSAIAGLTLLRSDHKKQPSRLIFKPALCVTVQGAKSTLFGDQSFVYGAGQALVVSVEMPAFSRVIKASADEPYLGMVLELDLAILREVRDLLAVPLDPAFKVGKGVCVMPFEGSLSECTLRLVRLLDTPKAIPVLFPAIMREISYWLLTGPRGLDIATITLGSSHAHGVIDAIHFLRDRFTTAIRIEELAKMARMSTSAFHRQFKIVTSMTPLQYQKELRLLEARRLMISDSVNVETAAFQVGYESPSQFSREYSRMFAMSPSRDVAAFKVVTA